MTETVQKSISLSGACATSKMTIRQKVWNYLEENKLVGFPSPCHGRIPNFKENVKAAKIFSEIKEFRAAEHIKVSPDRALEPVRVVVLEKKKSLYVAVPKLTDALLKRVMIPKETTNDELKKWVSRKGIVDNGTKVDLHDDVKLDLFVFGSVAVSRQGYRIGKGKGYGDLEFAMLRKLNAIDSRTIVVTIVHDCQVFDTLPKEIFSSYDVPVDVIVTPTKVIYINHRLTRPEKIYWNQITATRIDLLPVLNALRPVNESGEHPIVDVESTTSYYPLKKSYNLHDRDRVSIVSEGTGIRKPPPRRGRLIRRKNMKNFNDQTLEDRVIHNTTVFRQKKYDKLTKTPPEILFSLQVRNLDKTVQLGEFKKALAERGVKPSLIKWHGLKGYCHLHFYKLKESEETSSPAESYNAEAMLQKLENFSLTPESSKVFNAFILKPSQSSDQSNSSSNDD